MLNCDGGADGNANANVKCEQSFSYEFRTLQEEHSFPVW